MVDSTLIAILALLVAGTALWLGRRDLTRPATAFGVPWFGFVALAQLRLTDLEKPWSTGFTLVVFGGGLLFMATALLTAGTAPARGSIQIAREQVNARKLLMAAGVLFLGGVAGAAYKAHVLHGIPLLSDNPDVVRGRATEGGEVQVPTWSSALTAGFHLGLWAVLAVIWVVNPRVSRVRVFLLWLLAFAALFGVALEASRNLVIFAVAVPAVAAYVVAPRRPGRADAAWVTLAVCALALGVGGLFALRLSRGDGGARTYIEQESKDLPRLARPVLPVYVNGVYPLEAERRLYAVVPDSYPYDLGAASLTSLPDAAFPEDKPHLGIEIAGLMSTRQSVQLTWTVASYQGRLLADLGWRGVMLGSMLLGLLFGTVYRWARGRAGFLPIALVAYVAYYSAFLVYDNSLSFSLIAGYELTVVAFVGAYALGWLDEPIATLRQGARRLLG